jgi:hypothetical protein
MKRPPHFDQSIGGSFAECRAADADQTPVVGQSAPRDLYGTLQTVRRTECFHEPDEIGGGHYSGVRFSSSM